MITIIGTGHVFDLSSNLNFLFDKKKPDLICVELDKDRYIILSMRNSDSKQFIRLRKNVPLIYLLFMRFQEKTAKKYYLSKLTSFDFKVMDKMLELTEVTKDDLIYDLGCGDGRIVVTAAKKYVCKGVGYDIDPERVIE